MQPDRFWAFTGGLALLGVALFIWQLYHRSQNFHPPAMRHRRKSRRMTKLKEIWDEALADIIPADKPEPDTGKASSIAPAPRIRNGP